MRGRVSIGILLCAAALTCTAAGQQQGKDRGGAPESAKTWVFVGDSYSDNGSVRGGTRPHSVEAIKTFAQRCPDVAITLKQDKADYVVLLDHDGSRKAGRKRNKVAVVDRGGNVIYSNSTRLLGNAVKDSCQAIRQAKNGSGKAAQEAAYRQ